MLLLLAATAKAHTMATNSLTSAAARGRCMVLLIGVYCRKVRTTSQLGSASGNNRHNASGCAATVDTMVNIEYGTQDVQNSVACLLSTIAVYNS